MSLTRALYEMAQQLGDEMTADGIGPKFTCTEADSVARVLALSGHQAAAANFLFGHASEDEEDDTHVGMTHESVAEYVADTLAL